MRRPPLTAANRAKAWIAWALLLALSLWLIQWLWRPLAWGALLALGLSNVHERFCLALRAPREGSWRRNAATAVFCLLAGAVVLWPLFTVGTALASQIDRAAAAANAWIGGGAPLPDWLARAPRLGPWLAGHWSGDGEFGVGSFLATRVDAGQIAALAGSLGLSALARAIEAPIILAGFFWALSCKRRLAERFAYLHREVFSEPGEELVGQLAGVGRSVFEGVVILGLSEGALFWCAFALCGVPSPALLGFAAGFAAAIPLLSPLLCAGACLYAWLAISQGMGLSLAIFCSLILFVLDPLARSRLSGSREGGARAIWLYAAFLGGFSQFGLIGFFVGPMAVSACSYYWLLARRGRPPLPMPMPTPGEEPSDLEPRGAFGPDAAGLGDLPPRAAASDEADLGEGG
jgi:predicted PurR-regulated permease PerM